MIAETVDAAQVDRTAVWRIAAGALAFRVMSAVLALLVNLSFPLYQREQFTVWGRTSPFWDAFARYDSGWYFGIARYGYDAGPAVAGGRSNIAFAPVYPLLMRYIGRAFGTAHGNLYVAGVGISWVAFVLAMVALYHLASLDLPRRRAERAVLLTTVFPFSFFFGAVYSESTFLLFTVLAFYLFRTRRWVAGGLCGAIASATRVTGIVMWPALAWIAWRSAERTRRDRAMAAIGLALVAAGFATYCGYIYEQSGNPLLWAVALTRWGSGYHPGGSPWLAPINLLGALFTHPYVWLTTERMAVPDALYGVTAILFVIAIPFVWIRLGAGYALFMLLNLYLPLSSGAFEGLGRYCSILFPCFIWLASLKSRWADTPLVVGFATFYTLGLALFTTIHPLF